MQANKALYFYRSPLNIFQIHYETEEPNLSVCESQRDEFLDICRGKRKYQEGKFFCLESRDRFPVDKTIEIIPYFFSEGILVNESLFFKLKEILKGSGQWIECRYNDINYYYFQTSIVLDAIDYEASGCKFIDGYMVSIDPIVFKVIDYGSTNLFRIPRKEDGKPIWLFATELFKNQLEKLGVKNIRFVEAKI